MFSLSKLRRVDWLNYHHLLYFWTAAREGGVRAAAARLHVTQPTVSTQIHQLELDLGHPLFSRSGRNLVLTDAGRVVFRYADEIFSLGQELTDTLRGRPKGAPLRMRVGLSQSLPKLIAYRLLQPALDMAEPVRVLCAEGRLVDLLARLSVHDLDLVLADTAVPPEVSVRAFSHRLGESTLSVFAAPSVARRISGGFPNNVDGAPWLLPAPGGMARRLLDQWFETAGIRPRVVAEFDDSALLKVFGQRGAGVFAAPTVIECEVIRQYGVRRIGRADAVREQFFAISMERRVRHPGVQRITERARSDVFAAPSRRYQRYSTL